MHKYLLIALSLATFSCLAAGETPDISGKYTCDGYDPFSKAKYQAPLTVTKTDETYQFEWDFGKYGIYKGTGFFTDGINDFIPVTVTNTTKKHSEQNPYDSELQVYQIGPDGTLSGRWTFLGKSKVSPVEVCKKIPGKTILAK